MYPNHCDSREDFERKYSSSISVLFMCLHCAFIFWWQKRRRRKKEQDQIYFWETVFVQKRQSNKSNNFLFIIAWSNMLLRNTFRPKFSNMQICFWEILQICKYADMLLRNTFRPKIASSQFIHESFPFPGWKFRFNTWLKRHKGKFLNIAERFWKCIQFL